MKLIHIQLSYTADGKNWTRADAGNNTEATVSGLTVGTKYTVRVITNRGEETTVSSEAEVTATKEAQQKWGQITYGNGANASKDSFTGSANDGKVTIKSASGKLVPCFIRWSVILLYSSSCITELYIKS